MKRILLIMIKSIVYMGFAVFSSFAQALPQDVINDFIKFWPGLNNPQNTGLTVLPILDISSGGELNNLGRAYTAVSRDISFFDANASASSLLEYTEFAFFHRNLISDVNMDSVYFTRRNTNFGYGFGLKYLHFEFTALDGRGNQLASANPTEVLFIANASYNFWDNYYFSGLAVGINFKIAYRDIPKELYMHVLAPTTYNQNLVALMVDIGLLSRFNFLKAYSAREKNFSIGISAKNLGATITVSEPLPTEFSIGFAYKPVRFLMISNDWNIPVNILNLSKSEAVGFGIGLDIRFVEFFALQTGFLLRASTPRFSLGANIEIKPVSVQISYLLDLTTSTTEPDNFAVTAKLNFGDEGRIKLQQKVDELYIQALQALAEGRFQDVVELCNQIIDRKHGLDPSFTPAYATKDVALTTIERETAFKNFEQNREEAPPEADNE